jgi:hypothetical protein
MKTKQPQNILLILFIFIAIFFIGLHVAKIRQIWGSAIIGESMGYSRSDRMGEPIGADFTAFYAASSLALAGHPSGVYNFSLLRHEEKAIFHTDVALPWIYPPSFLLVVLPVALLPYLIALAVWLLSTLFLFTFVAYRAAPHPLTPWLTLAFPGCSSSPHPLADASVPWNICKLCLWSEWLPINSTAWGRPYAFRPFSTARWHTPGPFKL